MREKEPQIFNSSEERESEERESGERKYTIEDFTGRHTREVQELSEFLNTLPGPIKKILPPVELRNTAKEIHRPEEIEKIMGEKPNFNPDTTAGEYLRGRLILYAVTLDLPAKVSEEFRIRRPREILAHEISHFAKDYFSERGLTDEEEWDRVREADGNERNIFADYAENLVEIYGFKHELTCDEDFSESFRYFLLNPEKFAKEFPNRYAYCQRLVESLSISETPNHK